ncbi:MAG: SAM-dependent methyltransferase [Candidatus Magasanikbacteria bacterium CG10_big_fil_rev_8_21_14_0_10_36_32]|uniref:SAM-dependent methyltransferase n=1 Tax=Candidatus Magasanikbacteria bacterium CG10_big_fil_rev_8_21_14_0_10_36_32 TaxID=1974646 RepID=A0A2M6W790_9BACT|nr:MAG: SAM-dependent methyltransferase [Candidatus Magasanikbacteria bacterium CG10_big_fil_rev_8_21_14_0_10_36_32]
MLCGYIKKVQPNILTACPDEDYALLDAGEGEKLERYGRYVLSRPDPQALWRKHLSEKEWLKADAVFLRDGRSTEWKLKPNTPAKWPIKFGGLQLWIKPTAFKHTGLFPEQISNWDWLGETIKKSKRELSVLNLFAYTGGATLAAAQAGAKVCHVDGSKSAISWARENAELSGLGEKPIRWILDDVVAFVKREIKRGHKYDGIILDPPAFGHGPEGEMWKIEENLLDLLDLCKKILSDKPAFFLINGYAAGYSAIAYENALRGIISGGELEIGALTIAEEKNDRLLPCGIFARWHC